MKAFAVLFFVVVSFVSFSSNSAHADIAALLAGTPANWKTGDHASYTFKMVAKVGFINVATRSGSIVLDVASMDSNSRQAVLIAQSEMDGQKDTIEATYDLTTGNLISLSTNGVVGTNPFEGSSKPVSQSTGACADPRFPNQTCTITKDDISLDIPEAKVWGTSDSVANAQVPFRGIIRLTFNGKGQPKITANVTGSASLVEYRRGK